MHEISNKNFKRMFLVIFTFFFLRQFLQLIEIDIQYYMYSSNAWSIYILIVLLIPVYVFMAYTLPILLVVKLTSITWIQIPKLIHSKYEVEYTGYNIPKTTLTHKLVAVYRC